MIRSLLTTSLLLLLGTATPALAASKNEEITKPIKTLVQSVRYGKDLAALKYLAGDAQGRYLLESHWDSATEAQRKEFIERFHTLFAKLAFPKVRENFKNLESITYETPKVEGSNAKIKSTILILHPLKKQELKLSYDATQEKGSWKVVDVTVLGDSMLQGIRDDQIRPIMKEGGWPNLFKLMKDKEAELQSVKLK